jgi:hypothetical protein
VPAVPAGSDVVVIASDVPVVVVVVVAAGLMVKATAFDAPPPLPEVKAVI